MKFLTFAITSLGCFFLNSCFDIREEIWIEADGSGRAKLEYVIPSSALGLAGGEQGLRQDVERLIDSEPNLHLDEFKVTAAGTNSIITLKTSTESMLSLIDMQDNEVAQSLPAAASGIAGAFDVKIDGLAVEFDRRIDLQQALGFASLAISGRQREQRQLHYIIHLPTVAGTHNATETADAGRTLIWNYTLGEALSSPINTSFRARIPIPWWVYAGAALLLALLVLALSKAWKRHMRRNSEA